MPLLPPQLPPSVGVDAAQDDDDPREGLLSHHDREHEALRNRYQKDVDESERNTAIPTSSKHAEQAVAPFLAKHIPMQYNPAGGHPPPNSAQHVQPQDTRQEGSTKFCYRHRPDLKCRRQVNEPSMEQLQNELASLSQSDQQAISHVWSLFSAAPGKHRNLMLQGILTQCCFPQLSFISAGVRDLIKIDFLSALPPELGFKILCYLDTTSLCKAAQVSQRWRSLADDDVVWHKMCEQHIDRRCTKCGWGLPLLERKRLRTEKRQIQLRATGRGLNEWSPDITPIPDESQGLAESVAVLDVSTPTGSKRPAETSLGPPALAKRVCSRALSADLTIDNQDSYFTAKRRPWKDVYKDRFKVGTAWKYGRCSTTVFKGHSNGVMCLQFCDKNNVMITGSYDRTAKVWDLTTGVCIRTLEGHTMGIRALQFDDKKLMTGSLDHTMKLWNWRTGHCLRTFPAHDGGIITLHFTDRWTASGSQDRTIRVWDNTTTRTFLLRGHTDWVNCVRIDEASRTLFSASDDFTVRLWDLDTRDCIKVFEGHVGQVQQVLPMPAEFELDEAVFGPQPVENTDDDASSVSSHTQAAPHYALSSSSSHDHAFSMQRCTSNTSTLPPSDEAITTTSFWPSDPTRPAPPRYIFTGALDSTIRLWNVHATSTSLSPNQETHLPTDPLTNSHVPRANACIRTFFGHVEGIWTLAADHLRLISGSEDRMMKVWDPRTGKCERTFTGHRGPVTCAWLSDSRVASGSEDCEVRVLCFANEEEGGTGGGGGGAGAVETR